MKTFSIAVPTVNRPETLIHCLRTLVSQPGEDFEIVVSDDQGPPENRQIVESLARPDLVRYLRTPQRLGMRGNYEFCVENSRGRYVTILGDDDGFCVGALKAARALLEAGQPDVLFWFPHLYWWPNALIKHKQWMLFILAGPKAASKVNAGDYLKQFFENGANPWLFERLPSIYNGFVSQTLLGRIKQRTGRFFSDEIPDVYSGIANALMAQSAVLVDRPLTIRGLSGKSYGVAFRNKSAGAALREDFKRHMAGPMCEPDLIDSTALAVHIASVKLRAKRRFSELADAPVKIPDVITGVLSELNEEHDRYDDLVADARALAGKYQIPVESLKIPPRSTGEQARRSGVIPQRNGTVLIALNGEPLGIADIDRASLCVYSILAD